MDILNTAPFLKEIKVWEPLLLHDLTMTQTQNQKAYWWSHHRVFLRLLSRRPCLLSSLLALLLSCCKSIKMTLSQNDPCKKFCLNPKLKIISFKKLHPMCFLLCCQGPSSVTCMGLLWSTSHTAFGITAMARKPISKLFASWEASTPLTEIWRAFLQTRPSRDFDRICESQGDFQFPMGAMVQRGHRFVFSNWHTIYN